MSVRAYKRIIEPVLADEPTFNLWHNEELLACLLSEQDTIDELNEGCGTITVTKNDNTQEGVIKFDSKLV